MTPDKIGDLKAHLQRIASDDPKLEYYSITSKQARWLLDAAFSADDPEMDCTDAAHPAWWRGEHYGANAIVREVGKILDGTHDAAGTSSEPWESIRRKLIALVSAEARVQRLEAEVERLKSDHHKLGAWPDCKFCVSFVNDDLNGAVENARLSERAQRLEEALRNIRDNFDCEGDEQLCQECIARAALTTPGEEGR